MRRRARPSPSPLAPSTDDLDGSCGGQGAQAGGRAGPDLGPAQDIELGGLGMRCKEGGTWVGRQEG